MARSMFALLLLLVACVPQPKPVELKSKPVELKWSPSALAVKCPDPTRNFSCYDPAATKRQIETTGLALCKTPGLCADVKPGEICMCPDREVLCRTDKSFCDAK